MQIQISKKIILYLFILLFLATPNNKEFLKFNLHKEFSFEISSLSEFNDKKIIDELLNYKNQNLFLLNEKKIIEIINKYKIIEDYTIYKNYPSNLIVKFKKTQFLAKTQKEGSYYYIGSNGKLIRIENDTEDLPIIFIHIVTSINILLYLYNKQRSSCLCSSKIKPQKTIISIIIHKINNKLKS